ncbi:MAG: phytanoyl-CoA dioxygenase family protein [Myxococcales bacterium]|nr:phytanoyl-CoA dioxygenase family protein [Myxococcales bacterium]
MTMAGDAAGFAATGLARVPAAFTARDVAAIRSAVWATLAGYGIRADAPTTWIAGGALPLIEIAGALRPGDVGPMWAVGRDPACAALRPALARAVDAVFGPGVWSPADEHGGQAMPNLPIAGAPWAVPHAAWHVDEPTVAGQGAAWGLLGFACLDDVAPGGGATVAVTGSHRALARLAAARGPRAVVTTDDGLAALAAADPWFAELRLPGDAAARRARYLDADHDHAGLPLRVVELTGRAGDLLLMDPRLLHTVAANAGGRPRLVVRLLCSRAIAGFPP